MKTKHRNASHAKRRYQADPSAIYRVFNKVQMFTRDELLRLNMPVRIAFESLRTGHGEDGDFHTLAAAINCALIRSEEIDPLCVETCKLAQDGLFRAIMRHNNTGRWGSNPIYKGTKGNCWACSPMRPLQKCPFTPNHYP